MCPLISPDLSVLTARPISFRSCLIGLVLPPRRAAFISPGICNCMLSANYNPRQQFAGFNRTPAEHARVKLDGRLWPPCVLLGNILTAGKGVSGYWQLYALFSFTPLLGDGSVAL